MRSNLVGLGVVLALVAAGCKDKVQEAPEAGAAAEAPPAASSVDVTAPPPVVSGDPDVPLNEAVVGATPVPSDYSADTAPPAAVTEEEPASPETGDVWCPGYWWWSMASHKYVWVAGAWRNPPQEEVWTPGMWVSGANGHYNWVPGFWGPHGTPAPAAVTMAPPPPPFETRPPPPAMGYIWGPGYYAWRGERYVWVEGGWMPPRVGYGWVEPRWVDVGGRRFFQPGRWDRDIGHRGVVYRPDPNARPGERFTPVPVPATVVAAHENYNLSAARAIERGGVRQANGTITWHGPEHGGGGAPGAQGLEHGGPPGQGGEHGGPPGQGGEHGGPGGEHGGAPQGNPPPNFKLEPREQGHPPPGGGPPAATQGHPPPQHTGGGGSGSSPPPGGSSGHHGH